MSNVAPDPVEVWAPLFLTYAGTGAPKFTKEQVLEAKFAVFGNHCKLCDSDIDGPVKDHLRKHRHDLTAWLAKRKKENAKKSIAGLALARKEKAMARAAEEAADVIANLDDYPEEEDE